MTILGFAVIALAIAGAIFWAAPGIEKLNAEAAQAKEAVIKIVNQPITHLPRSGPVGMFSPGWFHDGATKPDFDAVDVRATQEFPYRGFDYVASDLNPTEMFVASELEFNAMTKYFYIDRTLPKKRLSQSEMDDVNGLYRIIGQDERALFTRWLALGLVAVGACLACGLLLRSRRVVAPLAD